MKYPSIHSVSPLEIVLFAAFVLYLIFPVQTPSLLTQYINSNIGIAVIIILTLYMLFYTTPILAILTLFVAYELLRRSYVAPSRRMRASIEHDQSQWGTEKKARHDKVKIAQPSEETTLEEQVISVMAPIGKSESPSFLSSSYKPNQGKISGASMLS